MACDIKVAMGIIDELIKKPGLRGKEKELLTIRARIEALGAATKTITQADTKPNSDIMDKAKAIGTELGLRDELVNETIAKLEKCSKG